MALLFAPVQDGKIVDTSASNTSPSAEKKSSSSSLDKEAFLQLLVAQMKYQDPLEPTSNTEYVSQLATFSSLEEMQNMNSTMEGLQASNLIGKQVIMRVAGSGGVSYQSGTVELVIRENGKTYLQVDGVPYSISDLDSIIDDSYLEASNVCDEFQKMVSKLPSEKKLTVSDQGKLEEARKAYDSMTDYQKQFVKRYAPQYLAYLMGLEEKMKKLLADAEPTDPPEPTEPTDPPEPTEPGGNA